MEDKFYAVIDTNVIVSAVISKHLESNPAKIIRAIVQEPPERRMTGKSWPSALKRCGQAKPTRCCCPSFHALDAASGKSLM